jgi:hypothetical protein
VENQLLSEASIRKFQSFLSWNLVSLFQKLSEEFIREFQDKVSWADISAKQKMSKDFVIDFKDKIIWNTYFHYQDADFSILKKYCTKTFYRRVDSFYTKHLTESQIDEIQKLLDIKYLFKN